MNFARTHDVARHLRHLYEQSDDKQALEIQIIVSNLSAWPDTLAQHLEKKGYLVTAVETVMDFHALLVSAVGPGKHLALPGTYRNTASVSVIARRQVDDMVTINAICDQIGRMVLEYQPVKIKPTNFSTLEVLTSRLEEFGDVSMRRKKKNWFISMDKRGGELLVGCHANLEMAMEAAIKYLESGANVQRTSG